MQKASLPQRTGEELTAAVLYSRGPGELEKLLPSSIELIRFTSAVFTPEVASGRSVFHVKLESSQACLPYCCHQMTASFHRSSVTMKATFSTALLVLSISVGTSLAVGELQVLVLSIFSAVDLIYFKIRGAPAI